MQIDILTKQDLLNFKIEIIQEIKKITKSNDSSLDKEWLRSIEVRKLLKISAGTLQNLRVKGILPYEKIGGIFYYAHEDINRLLGEIGKS